MRPSRNTIVTIGLMLVVGLVAIRLVGGAVGSGSLLSLSGSSGSNDQSQEDQGRGAVRGTPFPTGTPVAVGTLGAEGLKKDAFILLNPANATAGSSVSVSGSGFEPSTTVEFYLTPDVDDKNQYRDVGFAQTDSGGNFGSFSFTLPADYREPNYSIVASEKGGSHQADATGQVDMLRPSVKLGTNVGSVGNDVQFSAQGFKPNEKVNVYFNAISGTPIQTFTASNGGTIDKQSIRIPYGPVGDNSLIFVGAESQAPATVSFLMMTLYPTVSLSSYATKADTSIALSGSGFGPDEEVDVHLNNPQSTPIVKVKTSSDGSFENAGAFNIPFELTGKNTLILVGEKSRATATAGFDVLPYTPNIQPSAYGGRPGTTITFYGDGFARDEVVHFYVDRSENSAGTMVACTKTDDQGRIGSAGSYTIPANAQPGKKEIVAVGGRSNSSAGTTVQVMDAGMPIQTPADQGQSFHCSLDDQPTAQPGQTPSSQTTPGAQPSLTGTPPSGTAQPATTPAPTTVKPTSAPTPRPAATGAPTAVKPTSAPTATPKPTAAPPTPRPANTPAPSGG